MNSFKKTILPVIFDRGKNKYGALRQQYNCIDSANPNLDDVKNPSHTKVWEKCYNVAGEALEKGSVFGVSHYWTEPYAKEPDWAAGREPTLVFSYKIIYLIMYWYQQKQHGYHLQKETFGLRQCFSFYSRPIELSPDLRPYPILILHYNLIGFRLFSNV